MAVSNQVQFAAVLVPILGLVVTSAVDSVEESDKGWKGWYRVFVFGMSVAAIGPIGVASLLALVSVGGDVDTETILLHAGLAVFLTTFLILGVTLRETAKGADEEDEKRMLVGGVVVLTYYAILIYLPL